ncbi:MAG: hypothetical protein UHP28_02615 [Treponema sp.]|nr:hypothetical protein [Treponema sp.]
MDCSGCQTIEVLEQALGKKLKVPEKAPGRKVCACYMNGKTTILNRHCLLASLLRLIKYRRQFKKAGWWMKWNCRFVCGDFRVAL